MGGTHSKPNNFIDILSLDVGDLVLFTEKGGKSFYNVRYCKWISYSFAAFVVKNGNGTVELCGHFPSTPQVGGQHPVVFRSLESELASGKYDAVYARRLVHQPTPTAAKGIEAYAAQVVSEFAAALAENQSAGDHDCSANSKHCTHSDEEVAIMMGTTEKRGLSCTSSPVEQFTTSRLVADMLLEAGLITGDGHLFSATTHDEKVLAPVQEVELRHSTKRSSGKKVQIRSIMHSGKLP